MIKFLLGPECFLTDPGARNVFKNSASQSGDTALIWAVRSGQIDAVLELFLQGVAEPDYHNSLGSAAIHIATTLATDEMVNLLLEIGGAANIRNAAGKTALHLAARQNNFRLIRTLVRADICLDICDIQGFTALHRAASLRSGAAVLALLDCGADMTVRNTAGENATGTALHIAIRGRSTGGVLSILTHILLRTRHR